MKKNHQKTAPKPAAAPVGVEPNLEPVADAAAVEAAPETSPKFAWLKRATAQRVIDHAIASLTKTDFAAFGVDVGPAVEHLTEQAKKLGANRPSKPVIAVGSIVKLKAKAVPRFEGIIEASDAITVITLAKGGIRGQLANGDKVLVPRTVVELATA